MHPRVHPRQHVLLRPLWSAPWCGESRGSNVRPAMGAGAHSCIPPWEPGLQLNMSPARGAVLKLETLHGSRGANVSPALGAAMGAGVQI